MQQITNPYQVIIESLSELRSQVGEIASKLGKSTNPSESDQILSHKDAAKLLCISPSSLTLYISQELIPYSKIGKHNRFSRKQLLEWISNGGIKEASEKMKGEKGNRMLQLRKRYSKK